MKHKPGVWASSDGTTFDLLVSEALAGPGTRGADLGVHGRSAARRTRGLESTLVGNSPVRIEALDSGDDRALEVLVAGPAALTRGFLGPCQTTRSGDRCCGFGFMRANRLGLGAVASNGSWWHPV